MPFSGLGSLYTKITWNAFWARFTKQTLALIFKCKCTELYMDIMLKYGYKAWESGFGVSGVYCRCWLDHTQPYFLRNKPPLEIWYTSVVKHANTSRTVCVRVRGKKKKNSKRTGAECKWALTTDTIETGLTSSCAQGKPVCGALTKRGVRLSGQHKRMENCGWLKLGKAPPVCFNEGEIFTHDFISCGTACRAKATSILFPVCAPVVIQLYGMFNSMSPEAWQ